MAKTATTEGTALSDAFLSYAHADDPQFRDALVSGLQHAGLRLWFDRESMPARGTTFNQEIRRAIDSSARLVLLIGPVALTRDYVQQEWQYANDRGLPVVPILRDGSVSDLPVALRQYQAVDARTPRAMDDVVQELVRLLSDPVPQLGVVDSVPSAPPHALDRPDLQDELWRALGLDRQRPAEAGRAPRAAALYGTAGVGKSTVAAAFARSIRARRVFRDGSFWLTCGPSFDSLAATRTFLTHAAVGARLPASVDEVRSALAEGLRGREILLVLDDARDVDGTEPFLAALDAGARVLLTTLDQA